MEDILEQLHRVDKMVSPFFALRDELKKSAFQAAPPMPQATPAGPPQGAPAGPPQPDPSQMQQAPPQPGQPDPSQGAPQPGQPDPSQAGQPGITPDQVAQLMELLQAVGQKLNELDQRVAGIEQATGEHAGKIQEHEHALEDHGGRIAQTAAAQIPAQ